MVMRGIAVSEGIAVGPILLYSPAQVQVQKRNCLESEIEAQLAHYHAAATAALNELQALTNSLAAHGPWGGSLRPGDWRVSLHCR